MKIHSFMSPSERLSSPSILRFYGLNIAFCTGILLSACSTNPAGYIRTLPTDAEVAQYNASVEPEERIVCRRETPVGSNVPRRVVGMSATSKTPHAFIASSLSAFFADFSLRQSHLN
jgi:hypothetical protein